MKKFAIGMVLVFVFGLVVSCDSSSFEVEPSGYQDLDGLGLCFNNNINPTNNREDYCDVETLNEELELYINYLTASMDVIEDSLNVGGSNNSYINESGSQVFVVTVDFELDTTYSLELYNDLELVFLQTIQDFDDFTNQNTVISFNVFLVEQSRISFSGTVNAKNSDTYFYRNIRNDNLSISTSESFTDYINNYILNDSYKPFTQTVINIDSMDAQYLLNLNHTDQEYSFLSSDAEEYPSDDFKILIEDLLTDYEFVEFVMPGAKQ